MEQFNRPTGIDWSAGGTHGTARFGEDSNLLVMFYNRSVQNEALSINAGRAIHEDKIYVKIQQPGEMLNVVDRPVTEQDKTRFRRQWTNFIHDRTQVPEGTPIDLLFPNHPAVADNMRAFGVFTIEQCAQLSAEALDTVGRGGQEYKNRAQKYLDMSSKGKNFHMMQRQIEERDQQIKMLEQQVVQMKASLEHLTLKVSDPVRASLQPPYIKNYDVQTDRINANSPTNEVVRRGHRRQKTVEDVVTDPLATITGMEPRETNE